MEYSTNHVGKFALALVALLTFLGAAARPGDASQPIILSVRIERGAPLYSLNGRRVEDRKDNSLLRNLSRIAAERGTTVASFIIIDVRAPLTEVGKLETALDKVGFTSTPRLFVTDFRNNTMNEIYWDKKAVPLPVD